MSPQFASTATQILIINYPNGIYIYTVEIIQPDSKILIEIVQTKMPFGKYKGTIICDLPVYYLEWLYKNGFPPGKLGMLLSSVYEIKINGLSNILTLVKNSLKK